MRFPARKPARLPRGARHPSSGRHEPHDSGTLELVHGARPTAMLFASRSIWSALTESACEDMALICEKNTPPLQTSSRIFYHRRSDAHSASGLLGNLIGNAYRYGRCGHIIVTLHRAGSDRADCIGRRYRHCARSAAEKIFRRLYIRARPNDRATARGWGWPWRGRRRVCTAAS